MGMVWLCSGAKAGPWTMEEIERLILAMEEIPYGKWSKVQSERNFQHRSQVPARLAHGRLLMAAATWISGTVFDVPFKQRSCARNMHVVLCASLWPGAGCVLFVS